MWPFSRVVGKEIKVSKANIDHWLEQGFDANIIVFDDDAPVGVFTHRLVTLMESVAQDNYKYSVRTTYIDKHDVPVKYKVIGLDWDGLKVQETYEEMGATMQCEDKKLVIAILENEQVLLGSY